MTEILDTRGLEVEKPKKNNFSQIETPKTQELAEETDDDELTETQKDVGIMYYFRMTGLVVVAAIGLYFCYMHTIENGLDPCVVFLMMLLLSSYNIQRNQNNSIELLQHQLKISKVEIHRVKSNEEKIKTENVKLNSSVETLNEGQKNFKKQMKVVNAKLDERQVTMVQNVVEDRILELNQM